MLLTTKDHVRKRKKPFYAKIEVSEEEKEEGEDGEIGLAIFCMSL